MKLGYLALSLLVTACTVSDDDPVDGIDDAFTGDRKADTGDVVDGTPEARAVLRLANTASLETLDHEVPLDSRAAANIVAARPLTTLAELDAVAYVGPIAFRSLLWYAQSRTWRDWLPGDCRIQLVVPLPMTSSNWNAPAQGGPYNLTSTEMKIADLKLELHDSGDAVMIGTTEALDPMREDGTFLISDSYSRLSGPDDRYISWGRLTIEGAIDSLGDVVVTKFSRFSGYGNMIFGYHGTRAESTGEGRASLP